MAHSYEQVGSATHGYQTTSTPEEEASLSFDDLGDGEQGEGPSIRRIFEALLAHRWLAVLILAGSMLAAVLYLQLATKTYTVSAMVSPIESQDGQLAKYAQLTSLVGLNVNTGLGVSNYEKFREILTSVALAQRLATRHDLLIRIYPQEWNSTAQRWEPPGGFVAWLRRGLQRLAGMPSWAPPSPKRLSEFLENNIKVRDLNVSSIVSISIVHKDPEFATWLLELILKEGDELIREKERGVVSESVAYVRAKLGEVVVQEHRRALVDILSGLEQRAMLAESGGYFAAEILDPPVASDLPTSPNPVMTLALALVFGAGVSLVVSMYLENRRRG